MAKTYTQITYEGSPALIIPIRKSTERWSEIELDDGSVIRAKLVVSRVARLVGQYDPDGIPVYLVQSNNILNAESPDSLRAANPRPESEVH